ncbi:MAG: DMT family transporter [bacterium]|nr:DMT family transporter [bacterium]
MTAKEKKGIIFALLGGTGWGLSGTCGQFLFSYSDAAPLTVTIYRLIFSGLFLILFNLIRHPQGMLDIFKDWRTVVHLIIYGVFGVGLCQLSYLSAISYTNSGTATVLQSSGIILVFIIASIMQHKAPRGLEYLCLALVMGGVFLLATHGDTSHLYLSKEGLFWGAAAAVAVALYTLLPGKLMSRFGTSLVLGYAMLIGGLVLFAVSGDARILTDTRPVTLLAIAFIVIVGTAMGFGFYLTGVGLCGPKKASMISSIEPVVATLTSFLFLHTTFMPIDLAGFASVILGCVLLSAM